MKAKNNKGRYLQKIRASQQKAIESLQLRQAHDFLDKNPDLLKGIKVEFSKSYILMLMAQGHFEVAMNAMLEYGCYNSHLLEQRNKVSMSFDNFLEVFENKLVEGFDNFMDMYDIKYKQVNDVLNETIVLHKED